MPFLESEYYIKNSIKIKILFCFKFFYVEEILSERRLRKRGKIKRAKIFMVKRYKNKPKISF